MSGNPVKIGDGYATVTGYKLPQPLAIGREGVRFGESPLADRRILQMRNIAHLIDLKRAGHTAALTELQIAQDALPRRYYGDGQSYNTASSIEHDMNLCLDGSARRSGHA